jgi:hypothetical protein
MRQLHVNQFHIERSSDVILLVNTLVNIGQRAHSTLDFALRARPVWRRSWACPVKQRPPGSTAATSQLARL